MIKYATFKPAEALHMKDTVLGGRMTLWHTERCGLRIIKQPDDSILYTAFKPLAGHIYCASWKISKGIKSKVNLTNESQEITKYLGYEQGKIPKTL